MIQNIEELIATIRLIRSENVSTITFTKLIERFGTPSAALEFLPQLSKKSSHPLKIYSKAEAEQEIELATKHNIHILTHKDENYPPLLKLLEDRPPILFALGHIHLLKKSSFAIVGSRNSSLLGQKNAFNFAQELGNNGFLVVSGMAKGIDASAHMGSLEKGTVAVLGSGIDVIYPIENEKLYNQISNQGVIISEFPMKTAPAPYNFPKRNRIISGMSRGVLVVEASLNSGSIITAKCALEQGREVFAIPGGIGDSRSSGANNLIKEGAILVDRIEDILNNIKSLRTVYEHEQDHIHNPPDTHIEDEKTLIQVRNYIIHQLTSTPIAVDILVQEDKYSYNHLSTAILELELCGKIERHPNGKISLVQN